MLGGFDRVKPTVLIATTSCWFPPARLAMAMAAAGCTVDAVCPSQHVLAKMSAVRETCAYRGLTPLKSFADAIAATKPDLIVPGDDLATSHLHRLYDREKRSKNLRHSTCELIERSLGCPESFAAVYARAVFMEMAREEKIRAPKTEVVANIQDLKNWIARTGFPIVLKANGTSGGEGVRVVHTPAQAERAFRKLQAPPLVARAAKRAVVDQDNTLLWPSLLRSRSVVNAQAFIAGREATSTVACWEGEILASLHFEVVNKLDLAGPSSVVRFIENGEMLTASEKIVRRLKLSGVHGFDFMLEARTGNAHLIEINPRSTQVGHLALGPGRDLPAALYSALSGDPLRAAPKVTENDTIALFPQEWWRDPASTFLISGYHDVPWEEPELLLACVSKRWKHNPPPFKEVPVQTFSTVRLPRL
jgi:Carbamoyl-phosphate synthase L chain, ATP binding domain